MTDLDSRGLTGWKARLLDRIRDLASEEWQILRDNELSPPWPQKPDPALNHLRVRTIELRRQQHDLKLRARACGIRHADVNAAANLSVWGHRRAPVLEGDEAVRARLIDAIADDIWTLEHMAALEVDRRFYTRAEDPAPGRQEQQQFESNMAAIWARAAAVASYAGLSDDERSDLWGRDQKGWVSLFENAIYPYDDIMDRWRAHSASDMVADASRSMGTAELGLRQSAEADTQPPLPQVLIDRAVATLDAAIREAGSEAEYRAARLDWYLGAIYPGDMDGHHRGGGNAARAIAAAGLHADVVAETGFDLSDALPGDEAAGLQAPEAEL